MPLTVVACSREYAISPPEEAEFFIAKCELPIVGFGTIEETLHFINDTQSYVTRYNTESNELIACYVKHFIGKTQSKFSETEQQEWESFSDWHKDIYGFRPEPNENRFGWTVA